MHNMQPFLRSHTVMDPTGRLASKDLYASYLSWYPKIKAAGAPGRRRTFTAVARGVYLPYGRVRYGSHLIDGAIQRGFVGVRLATPADNMHDDIPDGPLSMARELLRSSRMTEADIEIVSDLLVTSSAVAWSRKVAVAILEDWTELYPEVSQIISLIDLCYR